MLYPLSYSRAARQCIKGGDARRWRKTERPAACCKPTKLHKFQACEDTLYRSVGSILSVVRRRQW